MGAAAKWITSLINSKKKSKSDHEKCGKTMKWKLWKNVSNGSEQMSQGTKANRQKDTDAVKEEMSAVKIQTIFRAFLAKRALKALKALVRIQAIFRGRKVRKQATFTLQCMQALIQAEAHARAKSIEKSLEFQVLSKSLSEVRNQTDPINRSEIGWCSRRSTAEEMSSKLRRRQEGALRRERAREYALLQESRRKPSSYSKASKMLPPDNANESNLGFKWLEHCMTTNLREEYSKQYNVLMSYSNSGHDSSRAKQSIISRRTSSRPPQIDRPTCTSSDLSCETSYDGSTTSSSSVSSVATLESNSPPSAGQPGYMSLTTSIKAKQRASPRRAHSTRLHSSDNPKFHSKSSSFSGGANCRSRVQCVDFAGGRSSLHPS